MSPYGCAKCCSMDVPCVTLAVVTHVTFRLVHLYLPCHHSIHPVILPRQLYGPFHVNVNCVCHVNCTDPSTSTQTVPATSFVRMYGLYIQLPHGTIQTIQSSFFLPVWKNEQITISRAYDVRLIPFKLCWVHIDEAYAHVHFEDIMRTFIFRLFRAPSSS
jgi:hypothetical protein